jgi:queuine/archaeosine tRNA-ribosyltransferase
LSNTTPAVAGTPDIRERDLKRRLSFRDVFFLSFGGQSPLLSILAYGAVNYVRAVAETILNAHPPFLVVVIGSYKNIVLITAMGFDSGQRMGCQKTPK